MWTSLLRVHLGLTFFKKKTTSQFEDSTMMFLSGLPHQLFNRKGFAARETIVHAFEKFFATNQDSHASQLVKNRAQVLRRYTISESDIARFETVNGFGILLNLLPTAYWTIWHIYSSPALLSDIRAESHALLGPDPSLTDPKLLSPELSQHLPLLHSVMQEVLRYNTTGAAVRRVVQDHFLGGSVLLKKDSYCLVPNKGIHFNPAQWGADARTFQPDRFLGANSSPPSVNGIGNGKNENRNVNSREAFRGFGGGINACPGKAFATRLILSIVATVVARLDVQACTQSGQLDHPGLDESSMAIVVARPARKDRVKFVRRRKDSKEESCVERS